MERKNKKTKSVGNGEGSLYYSETLQAWIFQYVVNGSRKTMKQKKNEKVKDFKARATKIKNEINTNSYISNSTTNLYEILFNYIENNYKTGIISDRTHKRHSETLKLLSKCCKDFINKPIQKVTLLEVKKALPNFVELEYICSKTNENKIKLYSQNVIDKLFMLLKKGFKIATSERIISYNIIDNSSIIKPKSKQPLKKIEALSVEEEKKLVDVIRRSNHKYKNIILLALFTGMRIGEILALDKNNINVKENTVLVERTLTRNKEDKVILGSKTKTKAGQRTIYLNNSAQQIIKDILHSNIENMHNLVFYDYDNNTFITPSEINCFLRRLNEKEKICDHMHTHMLRHTYATRCIESGMSAKVLQKNLGHKKITTTLDTYTSVFEKFDKDENEKYNLYMKTLGI